jgi:hypothetical protein
MSAIYDIYVKDDAEGVDCVATYALCDCQVTDLEAMASRETLPAVTIG